MLEKLKMLLGVTEQDDILSFILDTVQDEVKNYCNIEAVPPELENVVVRMAVDVYRSEGYGSAAAPQTAKSVSRGDVTVTYGGESAAAAITGGKSVLDDYKAQLQAFRRLRW